MRKGPGTLHSGCECSDLPENERIAFSETNRNKHKFVFLFKNPIEKMMKSAAFVFLSLLVSSLAWGQRAITPTNEFTISGKVKTELKFSLADLSAMPSVLIGDVEITNHKGEPKGTAKNMKGILLKDLFSKTEFPVEKPKELSAFYITCIASDGYKIVYSWNELFNTETGNHVFIVMEKDGEKAADLEDRILMISTSDFKSGRRYLKGLQKIVVQRVD
jgi:hypothetical protein